MRRPTCSTLVTGIGLATGFVMAAADGTVPVADRDYSGARGPARQDCHRPFPSFLWTGTQAGDHVQGNELHSSLVCSDGTSACMHSGSCEGLPFLQRHEHEGCGRFMSTWCSKTKARDAQYTCHTPALLTKDTQAGYHHASKDVSDLASMVMNVASSAKSVEVLVVVLSQNEGFSTESVSDSIENVRSLGRSVDNLHFSSAKSTFPYSYPASNALSETVSILSVEKGASVQAVPLENAVSTVATMETVQDSEVNVVIVMVPEASSLEETDGAVRALTTTLEEKHHGHFMLFWTADFHGEGCGGSTLVAKVPKSRRLQEEEAGVADASTDYRFIKMTPDILSGVLVMILFVFILYVGVGCVGDIECPQSFPKVNPAKGREY